MNDGGETGAELRFDKATYTRSTQDGVPCGTCGGPLGDAYWKWQQHVVCPACKERLAGALSRAQSGASLGKAILLGGATAVGCGTAYAIFVAATHTQFAIATIGIAFLIAKVVRKASGGVGGARFQVVAVALTYLAATMGYIPGIWAGLTHGADDAKPGAAAAPTAEAAPAAPEPEQKPISAGALVVALAWLFGIMLAAPFLELTEAPLGLLIVAFGMWEAWKLSRGPPVRIEGPFRAAPAVAAPPPAA